MEDPVTAVARGLADYARLSRKIDELYDLEITYIPAWHGPNPYPSGYRIYVSCDFPGEGEAWVAESRSTPIIETEYYGGPIDPDPELAEVVERYGVTTPCNIDLIMKMRYDPSLRRQWGYDDPDP